MAIGSSSIAAVLIPSRGYNKTEILHKLEDLLVNDPECKDRFWTQSFEKVESFKTTEKGVWMLRSRVDQLLGSQSAAQAAIDAGYYDTRTIKTKKGKTVEEVRYHEHQEKHEMMQSFSSKMIGEKTVTGAEVRNTVMAVCDDEPVKRKNLLLPSHLSMSPNSPWRTTRARPSPCLCGTLPCRLRVWCPGQSR